MKTLPDNIFFRLLENTKNQHDYDTIGFCAGYRNWSFTVYALESDKYEMIVEEIYNDKTKESYEFTEAQARLMQTKINKELVYIAEDEINEHRRTNGVPEYDNIDINKLNN